MPKIIETTINERIENIITSIKLDTINEVMDITSEIKDPKQRLKLIEEKTEEANKLFEDIVTKNFKEVKGSIFDYLLDCKIKANRINSSIELGIEDYEIK